MPKPIAVDREVATPLPRDRLDSWKEIAAYLKRDIRTVQRWEKLEGLPIHRHQHQKRGSAFAYTTELDAWWRGRGPEFEKVDLVDRPEGQPSGLGAIARRGFRIRSSPRAIAVAAGCALAVAILFAVGRISPYNRSAVQRFAILAPPEHSITPALGTAIAPDGKRLAFVSYDRSGTASLWVRDLDRLDARRLPGTEGAAWPFWSSDGAALAFFANGKLKRTDLVGGMPRNVCDAPNGRGGAWRGDVIILAPFISGALFRVPASGGTLEPVTTVDQARRETGHRWPQFLPDGRSFIFFVLGDTEEVRGSYLGELGSLAHAPVLKGDSAAAYAAGPPAVPCVTGASPHSASIRGERRRRAKCSISAIASATTVPTASPASRRQSRVSWSINCAI